MVKKLVAAAVAAFLVTSPLAPPAHAAVSYAVVYGHDTDGVGLWMRSNNCGDANSVAASTATRLGQASGTVGTHSIGWQSPGGAIQTGPMVPLRSIKDVTSLKASIMGAEDSDYQAIVTHVEYSGEGYWIGIFNWSIGGPGWREPESGTQLFDWYWYDNSGVHQYTETDLTIAQHIVNWGDDGKHAWAGYVKGCDGQPFYLDNLRVTDGTGEYGYNFEQGSATVHLDSCAAVCKSVDKGTTSRTIAYGDEVWALGHSHVAYDDGFQDYFSAPGTLMERQWGSTSFVPVATQSYQAASAAVGLTNYAAFKRAPQRRTEYLFSTPGNASYAGGQSNTFVVDVIARVKAKVLDHTLREGQSIVTKGQIRPGNKGTKLTLQQKGKGPWQTIDRGRTKNNGKFTLRAKAKPGNWKLRVVVAAGGGNLGTITKQIKVKVAKRVPPPPVKTDVDQGYTKPDVNYTKAVAVPVYPPSPPPPKPIDSTGPVHNHRPATSVKVTGEPPATKSGAAVPGIRRH